MREQKLFILFTRESNEMSSVRVAVEFNKNRHYVLFKNWTFFTHGRIKNDSGGFIERKPDKSFGADVSDLAENTLKVIPNNRKD